MSSQNWKHSRADQKRAGMMQSHTSETEEEDDDLKDIDILLGRGTGPNEHNKFFRSLVAKNKSKYEAARTRKDRATVIHETVSFIKNGKGRFLKKVKTSCGKHRFVVISDMAVIRAKTKQAFRYCLEGTSSSGSKNNESELLAAKKESGPLPSSHFAGNKAVPAWVMPNHPMPFSMIQAHHRSFSNSARCLTTTTTTNSCLPPSSSNDHSALVLLAEQALVEQAKYERSAFMAMQVQQVLRMQESPRLGLLLGSHSHHLCGDYLLQGHTRPVGGGALQLFQLPRTSYAQTDF
jgi:hypothetical protein